MIQIFYVRQSIPLVLKSGFKSAGFFTMVENFVQSLVCEVCDIFLLLVFHSNKKDDFKNK
jgi:hypothetical protein